VNPLAELRVALVLATSTGGVGRHVVAVASGLSARGVRVAVFGPQATNERFGFGTSGATRFRAAEIGPRLRPASLAKTAVATLRLRALVTGADVVHAHGFRAALVSALALGRLRRGRGRRPAFVITFHNAMSGGELRRGALLRVMRRLARAADAVFVVSPDLAADIASSQRALVAAPVRAPERDPAATRRALDIPDDASLVVAIGRLHRQKGFDVLVRAATRWPAGRRVVVAIAGDGPQRAALASQIEELGVDVRLLGDRSDIADLLQAADVVAMPSRWEGWPLAAGEVLAAGRPFVASAVGGLPEVVGDAAKLVAPDDETALAAAIAGFLDDTELASEYRLRAIKRATQLPTDDDVVAQLLACYGDFAGTS
jgi:glycosyltransferase involved in cell wall biosynthesis